MRPGKHPSPLAHVWQHTARDLNLPQALVTCVGPHRRALACTCGGLQGRPRPEGNSHTSYGGFSEEGSRCAALRNRADDALHTVPDIITYTYGTCTNMCLHVHDTRTITQAPTTLIMRWHVRACGRLILHPDVHLKGANTTYNCGTIGGTRRVAVVGGRWAGGGAHAHILGSGDLRRHQRPEVAGGSMRNDAPCRRHDLAVKCSAPM